MLKRVNGPLEFELEFPAKEKLRTVRKSIVGEIRKERHVNGTHYHVSRIKNNGDKLILRLKGEKAHHLAIFSGDFLPKKYTMVKAVPVDANLYAEIESSRNRLERKFGEDYKTSVLLPVVYTQDDTDILVVLMCKKNK